MHKPLVNLGAEDATAVIEPPQAPRPSKTKEEPRENPVVSEQGNVVPSVHALRNVRTSLRSLMWGRDPHDLEPDDPDNWYDFNPKYIAILYIRLEPNGDIHVNHACFTPSNNTAAGRATQAIRILEDKIQNNWELGNAGLHHYGIYQHQYPAGQAGHQPGHDYDSLTFDDFNFYSQNELFIFIDGPNVRLQHHDLIGFKPFDQTLRAKDLNFSYFHAREEPLTAPLASHGKMMRVENYATKEDGTPIGAGNRNYSMDIKFRVWGGAAGWITMIIDPDTGNGAGNEP